MTTLGAPLLVVKDLRTYFYSNRGVLKAVDGVSLTVDENEVFCIIGETGCGKSVTALSVMRLIPYPGKILNGSILFRGVDLLKLSEGEMQRIRGKEIAMIFQNPMKSLNPVFNIGYQISEPPIIHFGLPSNEAWKQSIDLIEKVKIPDPQLRAKNYPHTLSGGMKQRSMIAMMISCEPKLLIADEPTTALDVTVQAQIMHLLLDIKKQHGMSIMLITHNFGLVAETGDKVAVMYCGKIVESGTVKDVFQEPIHPYTQGLLKCIPVGFEHKKEIDYIPGTLPNPLNPPLGCRFHPRCKQATKKCVTEEPQLIEIGNGHMVACHINGG